MPSPAPGGLAGHLRDAIRLNRARRAGYVRAGGWRAGVLSRLLVGAERALLPVAWLLDRQAAPFWAAGVPVLRAELADVAGAPAAARPIRRGPLANEPPSWTGGTRGGRTGSARRALRADDFRACAEALAEVLGSVRQSERDEKRHYALTVHVVESAGLVALRGAAYAEATDGATAPLTRRLVRGHLLLLPFARALDRAAGPVHARGAGLFVNDLPPIPFEADLHG